MNIWLNFLFSKLICFSALQLHDTADHAKESGDQKVKDNSEKAEAFPDKTEDSNS